MNRWWMLMGAAVVALVFLTIGQRVHIMTLGYEIEQAKREQSELRQFHQQLLVELETLSALDRIERIAVARLGMIRPRDGQVILVGSEGLPNPSRNASPGLRLVKNGP